MLPVNRAMYGGVCAALLAIWAMGLPQTLSHRPPERPWVEAEQKAEGAITPENQANPEAGRAEKIEPPILKSHPEPTRSDTSEYARKGREKVSKSWVMLGYSARVTDWLLVLFSALLFVGSMLLWCTTRRSVKIAERAVTVLERAHVLPDFELLKDAEPWRVQVKLSNVGRSFAILHGVSARFAERGPLPSVPPENGYDEHPTEAILRAEKEDWIGVEAFDMPRNQEGMIIYGFIQYEDLFGRRWRNRFAYEVWHRGEPRPVGGADYHRETERRLVAPISGKLGHYPKSTSLGATSSESSCKGWRGCPARPGRAGPGAI